MLNKKKIIWSLIIILLVSIVIYFSWSLVDYYNFKKVAKSVGGMPWQDGGTITMVRQPCVWDTPCPTGVCPPCTVSCPFVSVVWGPACTVYIEIDTVGQFGTTFIAAPIGFIYRGGGAFPVAGMQFLAGGASNAIPWVIGIPSAAASRIQKLVDAFNFIITGFKGK